MIEDEFIQNNIKQILNELKTIEKYFEKCSLRFISNEYLEYIDQFKNEIILNKINSNEIKVFYKNLNNNQIDGFILKNDQQPELFQLLNEMNFIDDQSKLNNYDEFYFMIKLKNGLIYKNNTLFHEKIFIEIFQNNLIKNKNNIQIELFKKYFNSFQIIIENVNINANILISTDESFQNLRKDENNEELIEIFNQFDLSIDKKYQNLLNNLQIDLDNLILNVQHKNRILNITFRYEKERNKKFTQFKIDELIDIMLQIKIIFQEKKLPLQLVLNSSNQLNKAIIQTPLNCLKIFRNQWSLLQSNSIQFIEDIDYTKDSIIKKELYHFNDQLNQNQTIDNISIFNLLKIVLNNTASISDKNYKSIMNKILLNLTANNDKFDLEVYEKIEVEINKWEKCESIKNDYFIFLITTVKKEIKFKI